MQHAIYKAAEWSAGTCIILLATAALLSMRRDSLIPIELAVFTEPNDHQSAWKGESDA
jgi:hypothetical protein